MPLMIMVLLNQYTESAVVITTTTATSLFTISDTATATDNGIYIPYVYHRRYNYFYDNATISSTVTCNSTAIFTATINDDATFTVTEHHTNTTTAITIVYIYIQVIYS